MDLELKGRTCLVVGASGGIGSNAARAFAREGVHCALAARQASRVQELAGELAGAYGVQAMALACDLGQAGQAAACVETVVQGFGRLDILAMCAGNPPRGRLAEIDRQQWTEAWQVKVLGTVELVRAALPFMRRQGYGRILIIAGFNGRAPTPAGVVGSVLNAGLANLAAALAPEVAPDGVTINVIDPHYTRTRRWEWFIEQGLREGLSREEAERKAAQRLPIGRPIEPEEVAGLMVYLASPHGAAITGAALPISGGLVSQTR